MIMKRLLKYWGFQNKIEFKETCKFYMVHGCLVFNVISGCMIMDKYLFGVILTSGPSMLPTLNIRNDLVFVDLFTTKFVRDPKKGEIVIC